MGLLKHLAEAYGYDEVMEFLEEECQDSVVPAICTQCKHTADGEPDLDRGWCEGCGSDQLKSALVIAGVI